jgi:hypothetical protein
MRPSGVLAGVALTAARRAIYPKETCKMKFTRLRFERRAPYRGLTRWRHRSTTHDIHAAGVRFRQRISAAPEVQSTLPVHECFQRHSEARQDAVEPLAVAVDRYGVGGTPPLPRCKLLVPRRFLKKREDGGRRRSYGSGIIVQRHERPRIMGVGRVNRGLRR